MKSVIGVGYSQARREEEGKSTIPSGPQFARGNSAKLGRDIGNI